MIHSARPTVSPVANIVFTLLCFASFENMVDLVDQFSVCKIKTLEKLVMVKLENHLWRNKVYGMKFLHEV